MKEKKKIILSILVCLIIMLVGTTTAYLSQGQSKQLENVVSTKPTLSYSDNGEYMLDNLIPVVEEDVIKFASQNALNGKTDDNICKYNEYSACSIYEFTIENTSNVSQQIVTSLIPTINEYKNLYLMVVESERNKVKEDIKILQDKTNIKEESIEFKGLNTILKPKSKKTYSIILYIKSTDYDQTKEDLGKKFGASININSVTTGYNVVKSFGESAITVDLSNGLIPVVYDETKGTDTHWFVADTSKTWYDYESQWWANAVSVDSVTEGVRSKYVNGDGTYKKDVEIAEADMLAMFVWIPRYSYTIGCTSSTSCYGYKIEGASNLSQSTPGAIDIKFVSKGTKETYTGDSPTYTYTSESDRNPTNWYTHPAFDFGGEPLSGIWVGKFETSVNPNSTCYDNLINKNYSASTNCQASNEDVTPRILPNVLSLVSQNNVYNEFETAKKFTSNTMYGLTGDSHMMKNSEWGAVAYLSQSIYGKYGNTNYTEKNKEIYKNDSGASWPRYTGRSQGLAPATRSYSDEGTYKYNDISTSDGTKVENSGTGASTTGNIYGIYDMSGGAEEYVMGYYTEASSVFGGRTSSGTESNDSGFTNDTKPENKYFDGYKGTIEGETKSIDIFTKSNEVIGHATAETKNWYLDYERSISASGPWVRRGGRFNDISDVGAFYSHSDGGFVGNLYSFRSVLVTIES